jgi:gluconolactonase
MSNFKVEQIHESVMNLLGKNLFHCNDTNVLYWCDILGGQILRMDLNNNNTIRVFRILGERTISFCVPIKGKKDQYIVGAGRRLLLVNWDGNTTIGQIAKVLGEIPINGVRINQVNVDKQGRLYFGTMISEEQGDVMDLHKRIGGLYRFTSAEGLVQLKDNVGVGNGIAWNSNFSKMFFTDSFDLSIYEFDFDLKTGNISKCTWHIVIVN